MNTLKQSQKRIHIHGDMLGKCLLRFDPDRISSWSGRVQMSFVIGAQDKSISRSICEIEILRCPLVHIVPVERKWRKMSWKVHNSPTLSHESGLQWLPSWRSCKIENRWWYPPPSRTKRQTRLNRRKERVRLIPSLPRRPWGWSGGNGYLRATPGPFIPLGQIPMLGSCKAQNWVTYTYVGVEAENKLTIPILEAKSDFRTQIEVDPAPQVKAIMIWTIKSPWFMLWPSE